MFSNPTSPRALGALSLENWKLAPRKLRYSQNSPHWNPRRAVLGVELRGSSLHLACVRPGLGRSETLMGVGRIPHFEDLKPEELQERLGEFLKIWKGEEPLVVLGLPRREAIVRLFTLPPIVRKSLEDALNLQVEMCKPTDTEQFCWDASLLRRREQLAISLVLAPRASIERVANRFSQAGYPVSRITVGQFSLLHLYLRSQRALTTERVILFRSTESEAEIAALEGEKLVYSRGFALPTGEASSGQAVTPEIQQAVSSLRWHEGGAFTILLASLVSPSVEKALGTFGCVERLESKLQLEWPSEGTDLGDSLGSIAVALSGLGRRRHSYRLNLLPPELRPTRRRWRHAPTYALLAANAMLLVATGLRRPIQDSFLLRQYRRENASLKTSADEMKSVLHKDREFRKTLNVLEEYQRRGREPIQALNDVARRLPPEAWLNTFSSRKNQIELVGSAKSASSLLSLFQASPQFEDVKFNGALTQDSTGRERFRVQMRLKEKR